MKHQGSGKCTPTVHSNVLGKHNPGYNQKTFAEHMMTQYGITTAFNIPASPGVDLGSKVEGETGGNEEFEVYYAFV